MATLQDAHTMRCPICLEQCAKRRKMPNCAHSFCEPCLITYTTKLLENNGTGNEITCPLCKVIHPALKDKDETIKWVMSLEQIEDVSASVTEHTGEPGSHHLCDSCHMFGIAAEATKICLNCLELFCQPCCLGRHSGKLYKNHKVRCLDGEVLDTFRETGFEEFRLLKEYSCCNKHDDKPIEFYCKDDDSLCCAMCFVANPKKCDSAIDLQDSEIETGIKAGLKDTKDSIDKLYALGRTMAETLKKSVDDLKLQTENMRKTIQEIRTKVIKLLETLEETVIEQIKATAKEVSLERESEIALLMENLAGLSACSSLADKTIKFGSVCHCYGITRKLKEQIKPYKAVITDTFDKFNKIELEFKIEPVLENVLQLGPNETHKLANVVEKRQKMDLPINRGQDLLKHYSITRTAEKRINENYIVKYSPTYSDLVFLPNDCAVLVDTYNNFCCLTDNMYKVVGSQGVASRSCCVLKDGTVAVTSKDQNKIYILNVDEQLKITREIPTRTKAAAIQGLENGDIALALTEPAAFGIITVGEPPEEKAYFKKDKSGRELKEFNNMAVDAVRRHVVQPCKEATYCFDYDGNPKFKYTNIGLSSTDSVALDRDGNIYLCSWSESAIHVVSPIGTAIKVIKKGCPINPRAIAFKKNGEEFAVTRGASDDGVVTFFKLEKPCRTTASQD